MQILNLGIGTGYFIKMAKIKNDKKALLIEKPNDFVLYYLIK